MVYALAIYTPRKFAFKKRSYEKDKAFGHSNVEVYEKKQELKPWGTQEALRIWIIEYLELGGTQKDHKIWLSAPYRTA